MQESAVGKALPGPLRNAVPWRSLYYGVRGWGWFLLRRLLQMVVMMFFVSMAVFYLVNIEPNLKKYAMSETHARAGDQEIERWLERHGYRDNFFVRYGEWLGVLPKHPTLDAEGNAVQRFSFCEEPAVASFDGVLQGNFGCSTKFDAPVADKISGALRATGILMFWAFVVMVPAALAAGVLAGIREGTRTDRALTTGMVLTTSMPEYVAGVLLTIVFASWLGLLNGSAATATTQGVTFNNIALPVITIAIHGAGYIARMTRVSMAEVMQQNYIRTARLKGLKYPTIIFRHALRNGMITPFTIIMLQFPWMLNGVIIVELMFRYQGFGFTMIQAADSNDIDLLLACSLVSVFVVLSTQIISDIGYILLNPRIRTQ